ncbi:MAG: DUF177 domain-containing protein [Bacteroidia bacterium]|nr:DUF177 domain-containing protein [Bacteroidia bacterium]
MELEKSDTMIQLHFHIKGSTELVCDRSLEPFEYPINLDQNLILKFGTHSEALTEEIEVISRNTIEINVAQPIYEFIGLAIPYKKLHPRFQSAFEEVEEDDLIVESQWVYSSDDKPSAADTDPNPNQEENLDPRWQILKKLKN